MISFSSVSSHRDTATDGSPQLAPLARAAVNVSRASHGDARTATRQRGGDRWLVGATDREAVDANLLRFGAYQPSPGCAA